MMFLSHIDMIYKNIGNLENLKNLINFIILPRKNEITCQQEQSY